MKALVRSAFALAIGLASQASFASGGYSGGGTVPQPRAVDPRYEAGKSIAHGRSSRPGEVALCIAAENEAAPRKLGRVALAPYKRASVQALADRIVDCSNPSRRALEILERDDLSNLLYYLNKRYSLRLT